MYKPVLVTPPADELIVSLARAKEFLREDTEEHDAVITRLLKSAQQFLDGYEGVLGRALLTQTWEVRFCYWMTHYRIPLIPFDPVTGIDEINYYDVNNVSATVNASDYYTLEDNIGPYLLWKPDTLRPTLGSARRDAIGVRFTVGYGGPDDVPEKIKLIIEQLVVHWFEGRSPVVLGRTVAHLPFHIRQLITVARGRVGLN